MAILGAQGRSNETMARSAKMPGLNEGSRLTAANLLDRLDVERIEVSARLAYDPVRRADFGQFLTPTGVARFMAGMLEVRDPTSELRILDAGGGTGLLTAAVVSEFCNRSERNGPKTLSSTVWEIDEALCDDLARTLEYCRTVCIQRGIQFVGEIRQENFISAAADLIDTESLFAPGDHPAFHVAILNPPYRKLRSDSPERKRMSSIGIETSNLYAAFVWLAMELLEVGGELVAITPRSFMNGSYFRAFRRALHDSVAFRRVHVYDARDVAFAGDDVLQENVIFHCVRGATQDAVTITTSFGPGDTGLTERVIEPSELVVPSDPERVLHVVPDATESQIAKWVRALPNTLADLGVTVSTGRVVGFRAKHRLHFEARTGDAPLILARHSRNGFISWPNNEGSKPNALAVDGHGCDELFPSGWYVLVNRFSAKEEKRRIVAALYDPSRINARKVAFDNKLNVLHRGGCGLPEDLAKGIAVFLNSTIVDAYFRQFSGHTQVNAADLRSIRFPEILDLKRIGGHIDQLMPSEDDINQLLREEIGAMKTVGGPIAVKRRIQSAREILGALQAPKGQQNERSALTLLGLLDLGPNSAWSTAQRPLRGVTELMDWMAETYGKRYAPNTRETIRRFTLHQFIEMGLVLLNPDSPGRPPNSPKNVYQIEPTAHELIHHFGSHEWSKRLVQYLDSMAGKNRLQDQPRQMQYIPVRLLNGQSFNLTAGGQNVLVKKIIEDFAPRFTPGCIIVYVGDAGKKHLLYEVDYLKELGVEIDPHGKMPDVVIHDINRNWMILVEAVTSHGPVNTLRHNQLKELFAGSTAGVVFVTTFLNRATMREYLPEISWETEVWVADAPEHLIHFDGERFLGPYGNSGIT